jgi:hypothetical protein
MAVHYIHVQHRRAAALHGANAVSEARKIRGQDGRRNFHRIFHGISAHILPDSRISFTVREGFLVAAKSSRCHPEQARDLLFRATKKKLGDANCEIARVVSLFRYDQVD